jgi:ABC-type lipoprotein export system ATPase subunit
MHMVLVQQSRSAPPRDVVVLAEVWKSYPGRAAVRALERTVGFAAGSFTAVMGPSGSGKSTLLHCAAGLDRPSEGRVLLAGQDISELREPKPTIVRRAHVGFVFQSFNLVDALSGWDNVLLPREVLALVAQGLSNSAIWTELVLAPPSVEKHITNILTKSDLPPADDTHRRVRAVLAYLNQ